MARTPSNRIDESTLTKEQLRKLTALRKSIGGGIGEWAFTEWLSSQLSGKRTDRNAELIADTLWPLVQQGRLAIPRGGYLVRRGRGRIIVEPEAHDAEAHDAWFRAKVQEALDDPRPTTPHEQVMSNSQALIDGKRHA